MLSNCSSFLPYPFITYYVVSRSIVPHNQIIITHNLRVFIMKNQTLLYSYPSVPSTFTSKCRVIFKSASMTMLLVGVGWAQHSLATSDSTIMAKSPLSINESRERITHILRMQDLVDGFLSRAASKLDSNTEAFVLNGANSTAVNEKFEIDLSPSVQVPGSSQSNGTPPSGNPSSGGIPSTLAALLSTTGKLWVTCNGHIIIKGNSRTASYDIVMIAKTDIVLTDAVDAKVLTVKKGTRLNYSFVWSKASNGEKTYASMGRIPSYKANVVKNGSTFMVNFATTFDISVKKTEEDGETVDVAFDDTVLMKKEWDHAKQYPYNALAEPANIFRIQFRIEDQIPENGFAARILKAATYAVDGIGLALDFSASDI